MPFCNKCGKEIVFIRTANDNWMPCDALTGEKHFHDGKTVETSKQTGIITCPVCGRPVFKLKKKNRFVDYTTLEEHKCNKADVTRYAKYMNNQKFKDNKK